MIFRFRSFCPILISDVNFFNFLIFRNLTHEFTFSIAFALTDIIGRDLGWSGKERKEVCVLPLFDAFCFCHLRSSFYPRIPILFRFLVFVDSEIVFDLGLISDLACFTSRLEIAFIENIRELRDGNDLHNNVGATLHKFKDPN